MNLDTLLKDTLDEWSAQAQVPAGLAEAALRRRSRRRTLRIGLAAGSTAVLVAAAAAVFSIGGTPQSSSRPLIQPATLSTDTSVRADLGTGFPNHLVAAGHVAVGAYYAVHAGAKGTTPQSYQRTWYVYDPALGTYQPTPWAYVDVAPGLQQAAVLEGPLPASRVGILDLRTQQVIGWIPVPRPVGGLVWSPDGRRLLLTTYTASPDTMNDGSGSPRSGFYVVNAAAELGPFHPLPPIADNWNTRQDLGWSRTGTLIWAPTVTDPSKVFYDLNGAARPAPAREDDGTLQDAGLSPDGTMQVKFGPGSGPAVTVSKISDGRKVAVLPLEQARAWADDHQLFGIGCGPDCSGKGEFHNRLVLADLDGTITPLTQYRKGDQLGTWEPTFTHR